jgi:hypothetical protein
MASSLPRVFFSVCSDAFKPYISHGVLHILRVPSGKIARVWDGSKAILLEYRAEPYVWNSPLFRLEPASNQQVLRRVVNSLGLAEEAKYSEDRQIEDANTAAAGTELFEDSTSPCIVHGSIKRLQPRTGEVCLCYENGQLVIREPPTNGKPIWIDDENCRVDGFISVGVQTLVFPSDETKALRKRENAAITTEECNYEIFTTVRFHDIARAIKQATCALGAEFLPISRSVVLCSPEGFPSRGCEASGCVQDRRRSQGDHGADAQRHHQARRELLRRRYGKVHPGVLESGLPLVGA